VEIGIPLTVVGSQAEADIICGLLRANGVRCSERSAGLAPPGTGGFGGWREILVSKDQLEAARELLAATPISEPGQPS
jgi:hypothetical protein